MGLATNIEHWDMSAAIGMATEGVRAKYNIGGGGFGAADMEIASKLDGGKILAVVHKMGLQFENLGLWVMFAYASPNWNRSSSSHKLFEYVINDWVFECAAEGNFIQMSMFERIQAILPMVAGGLALEQISGADVSGPRGNLVYHAAYERKSLILMLVEHDCNKECVSSDEFKKDYKKNGPLCESFRKKRTRYYQSHWDRFSVHIEHLRSIIVKYDTLARKIYKKQLEKQLGAI